MHVANGDIFDASVDANKQLKDKEASIAGEEEANPVGKDAAEAKHQVSEVAEDSGQDSPITEVAAEADMAKEEIAGYLKPISANPTITARAMANTDLCGTTGQACSRYKCIKGLKDNKGKVQDMATKVDKRQPCGRFPTRTQTFKGGQ